MSAERIVRWFAAALDAVDPEQAVAKHLGVFIGAVEVSGRALPAAGKVVVVAIGKAAVPMARAAERQLGERLTSGIAITKDGHSGVPPLSRIQVREASHPIPDERGIAAAAEALALVSPLGPDDLVVALISGGGSALFEAPVDGVSLADMAATTQLLLRAGAPIEDLNAVRGPLSRVKGGGFRAAAPRTRFATLILSDVLGNDPSVIASGPTVSGGATGQGALAILDRYSIRDRVPGAVVSALEQTRPGGRVFEGDILEIIADNRIAVAAFAKSAQSEMQPSKIVWTDAEGEARDLARQWVDLLAAETDATLMLGGGEATVTVRGDGAGGRNTEFALAAALELERRGLVDWTVASLATDGQDALTGVAGAIATAETPRLAREAGVDPVAALERNDSLAVFKAAGGWVETGPTGTNVNDIYVALRRH